MDSVDEGVASVAFNSLLGRAFGKPKEIEPEGVERSSGRQISSRLPTRLSWNLDIEFGVALGAEILRRHVNVVAGGAWSLSLMRPVRVRIV
jgi:hypothetical protein